MPAGTPKRRLSECNLDNRLFWGAKSLIARKDTGSARVETVGAEKTGVVSRATKSLLEYQRLTSVRRKFWVRAISCIFLPRYSPGIGSPKKDNQKMTPKGTITI